MPTRIFIDHCVILFICHKCIDKGMHASYEFTAPAATRGIVADHSAAPEQLDDPESKFELLHALGEFSMPRADLHALEITLLFG